MTIETRPFLGIVPTGPHFHVEQAERGLCYVATQEVALDDPNDGLVPDGWPGPAPTNAGSGGAGEPPSGADENNVSVPT
jgi:hypothetical protein